MKKGSFLLFFSILLALSFTAKASHAAKVSFSLQIAGSGKGQLQNPTGIAVSLDGMVYVVDSKNNRIQLFTSSGEFKVHIEPSSITILTA